MSEERHQTSTWRTVYAYVNVFAIDVMASNAPSSLQSSFAAFQARRARQRAALGVSAGKSKAVSTKKQSKCSFFASNGNGCLLVSDVLRARGWSRLPLTQAQSHKFQLRWVDYPTATDLQLLRHHQYTTVTKRSPKLFNYLLPALTRTITNKACMWEALQAHRATASRPSFLPLTYGVWG